MANVSEAYVKLADLYVRSVERANAGVQEEARSFWSGVGFTLGGLQYLAPMSEVAEILSVPKYTQVPGVQGWVKGIANVRGRLLPIMDLQLFFDRAAIVQSKKRRLLVLEKNDVYSGLIVDEIMGMQHFPDADYTLDLPEHYAATAALLEGGYRVGNDVWAVFHLHKLVDDIRFMNVASSF